MGFFHPAQLAWLLLAAAVPLLYWAVHRRSIDVSSHVIWSQVLAGTTTWRRWQRLLSATAMAVLLATLAFVLAEPYWQRDRAAARTIVLVLDVAAQADARQSALSAVEHMKLYERMAIVLASDPTRVICPLTDDRVRLRQIIEEATPQDARSVSAAVNLAEWMLAAEQHPTVIVCPESSAANSPQIFAPLAAASEPSDPPGVWLLAAALALCGGEWLLFSRRVTV